MSSDQLRSHGLTRKVTIRKCHEKALTRSASVGKRPQYTHGDSTGEAKNGPISNPPTVPNCPFCQKPMNQCTKNQKVKERLLSL